MSEDILAEAREAADGQRWAEAYVLLGGLAEASLPIDDHERLADAAWWTGHMRASMEMRGRLYARLAEAGEHRRCAYQSWFLALDYRTVGEASSATGWVKTAERHLRDVSPCWEHGLLHIDRAMVNVGRGKLDEARAHALEALEIDKQAPSPEIRALALHALGRIALLVGEMTEGMDLLDESMVSVLAGGINPVITGLLYCSVLDACIGMADVRRATEWTEASTRWCESLGVPSPYHGICRVHRAEVTLLCGELDEAERHATHSEEDARTWGDHFAAESLYALGEIARRRGDLVAAEQAFTRAHVLGRDPQPGLALVRLAQGKAATAATALRLEPDDGATPLRRAHLFSAAVLACIAAGDTDGAQTATEGLEALSAAVESPALRAYASAARAQCLLARNDAPGALRAAREAFTTWTELGVPYEAARARVALGLAFRRSGDEERAGLEIQAARVTFERLGAVADAAQCADLMSPSALPAGLSQRELEVLRLVAGGKTNREIAAELILSEHTVSRHLQNIFRKLDVSTRAAATAYAFEHSLV